MLSRTGAASLNRSSDQIIIDTMNSFQIIFTVIVTKGQDTMKVSVAGMAKVESNHILRLDILGRRRNQIGKKTQRHAGVGDQCRLGARSRIDRGIVQFVPGRPQMLAFAFVAGKSKVGGTIVIPAYRLRHLHLFVYRRFAGTGKLQKQCRLELHIPTLVAVRFGISIESFDAGHVQQLTSLHRHTAHEYGRHGLGGLVQTLKATHGGGNIRGYRVQPDRNARDDPQRPLAAGHQPHQIVSRAALEGIGPALGHGAVRQDALQPQHVVPHGAVLHRRGSRGTARHHPPDRGVGAGIDHELHPGVPQGVVEGQPGNSGAHRHVGVGQRLPIGRQIDVGKLRHVEADAPPYGRHVSLEGRADAEGHNGHLVLQTVFQDGHHLRSRCGR